MKKAKIKIIKSGTNFACYAVVKSGRKILHETGLRPHGMTGAAYADAVSWAAKHGWQIAE